MKRWFSALMTWAVFSGAAYPYAVSLVAASVSISLANPSLLPCLRAAMLALQSKGCSFIVEVRGRGLLNAVEVDPSKVPARCNLRLRICFLNVFPLVQVSAWDLCVKMAAKGLLAKPTHVRICPHNNIVLEDIKPDACAELRDPLCPPSGDDRQPDARMCVGVLRPSFLRPF